MNIEEDERPVVAAIHPKLIEELKIRKETIEKETGRKAKGGVTCFSEMAALELRSIRYSGDKILTEILKFKDVPIQKLIINGREEEFVSREIFKKVFIFCSVLSRKKDQSPIKVEITKIRGLKKNEIKYFW